MKTHIQTFLIMVFGFFFLLEFNSSSAQTVSTFENLTLAPDSYWDGSDLSGGFSSGNAYFYTHYDQMYSTWGDFIYTNGTDNTTAGFTNSTTAITGSGYNGSDNYVVSYVFSSGVKLTGPAVGTTVNGFFVTNTTFAALSMRDGDAFAKKFGGATGDDADWFKLTVTGYLNNNAGATTVDFFLADFRFADNSNDYIIDTWKWVDLTSLGNVDSLSFALSSTDNGMWGMNTPPYFALDNFNDPLFAPIVAQTGTSAMYKDSSAFTAWATACTVVRGPQNISNLGLGNTTVGDNTSPLGQAGLNGVVSLGDGGSAILTFAEPIANGAGNDFAVFENSFSDDYLELGFVEVSSDGVNFFRFPSTSLTDETTQVGSFGSLNAKKLNNLAGKYKSLYGTPFDLEELKNKVGLDVNHITHVKIIDVVGNIDPAYATHDANGNKVNDPWPTAFASGGFDLDAVGVVHTASSTGVAKSVSENGFGIYPNPITKDQFVNIQVNVPLNSDLSVQVLDYSGQIIKEELVNTNQIKISTEGMIPGVYLVKLASDGMILTKKLVIN